MSELTLAERDDVLREIADTPSTLEFRDLALDSQTAVYRSGDGLLLVNSPESMWGAVGAVLAEHVDQLCQSRGSARELLADSRAFAALESSFPFSRAIILVLDCTWQRAPQIVSDLVLRILCADDRLDHLPADLREEIEKQTGKPPIFAGFVDSHAVSFAYTGSMTETLCDISIDTLAEYRRRGIARQVVSCLIDHVFAQSKAPVWGAIEDNVASLALAASLGFTRSAGELFVCEQ